MNVSALNPTDTACLDVYATGGASDANSFDVGFDNKNDANAVISGIGTANKVDFYISTRGHTSPRTSSAGSELHRSGRHVAKRESRDEFVAALPVFGRVC
jgi:hypothetical protein